METCIARFMCGHEEQVEVSGTEEEVRKRIEWYGANCQCSECRTKRFRDVYKRQVVTVYYMTSSPKIQINVSVKKQICSMKARAYKCSGFHCAVFTRVKYCRI